MRKAFILFLLLFCLKIDLIMCAEEIWPPSVSAPDFLPGCAEFLLANPVLFEGGGEIVRQGDSWVALGVGTALLGKGKNAEHYAWEKANIAAMAALAETIWGLRPDFSESLDSHSTEGESGVNVTEQFNRFLQTERGGVLVGSWEGGRWNLHDETTVGVLRVIASPGHPIQQLAGRIPIVSDTLDPVWKEIVLSRPILRYGGVATVQHQNKTWFLVAGCTPIPKRIPFVPPVKIGVAEDRARAEWIRFTQGVQLRNDTQSTFEMIRLQRENIKGYEGTIETLSSSTETRTKGETRMIPVGMWLSDAGKDWRLVAVFRLSLENSSPENYSHPMTRPSIPQTGR